MSTSDDKLDRVLEHILDLKEAVAELRGEHLPDRVKALEGAVHENDKKWARLAGVSAAAGVLGGGFLGALGKKLGLTP